MFGKLGDPKARLLPELPYTLPDRNLKPITAGLGFAAARARADARLCAQPLPTGL